MCKALAEKYAPPKYAVPTSTLPLPKLLFWAIGPLVAPVSRDFIKKNFGYAVTIDNTKSQKELGMDYYPLAKTMQDMYQQLLDEKVIEPKA